MAKARNIVELIGVLGLIILGTIQISDTDVYTCPGRNIAIRCNKISSTAKTCYNAEVGNRICSEGWTKLDYIEEKNETTQGEFKVRANNKIFICNPIENEVNSYTKCNSENSFAYLGELI